MKLVVAIDSFKGSAGSAELNHCVAEAAKTVSPTVCVQAVTIADGGEGTVEALQDALGGEMVWVDTVDLLGRPIRVTYLIAEDQAFIESASVIGIDKIIPSPETIEQASSFGLGAVLRDAVQRGCRKLVLTLGGSGTSDGGRGLLESFGSDSEEFRFTFPKDWQGVSLVGLTDVKNIYAGEAGYAKVFGKQKGGTKAQIDKMDWQAHQFVLVAKEKMGIDLQKIAGTGAAGGLGAAIILLGGQLESGFQKVATMVGLEEKIKEADLVITGEGRLDAQSRQGKVPFGVAQLAKQYKVPTIAVCGSVAREADWLFEEFLSVFSIQTEVLPLKLAMEKERTLDNLRFVVQNILRTYRDQ